MKNKIISLFVSALLAVLVFTPAAQAQTATARTALSAAVTNTTATTFQLLAVSGITTPTATAPIFGYVDQELVQILSINTTALTINVLRGQGGTFASTHLNGATFFSGPSSGNNAGVFINSDMQGSCTRTNWIYLPVINPKDGNIFDCILSPTTQTGAAATTSEWVAFNAQPIGRARPYKKLAVTVTTYTLLPSDEIVGYNTNVNGTITIPALTGFIGKIYTIQSENTGVPTITIATSSGQTINGAASITMPGTGTAYGQVQIYSDGRNWFARAGY